jgi:hypothetical protein
MTWKPWRHSLNMLLWIAIVGGLTLMMGLM